MAGDTDQDQKTEQPTDKRLQDARTRGQLPMSRDTTVAIMLLASAYVVTTFGPSYASKLSQGLVAFIDHPEAIPINATSVRAVLLQAMLMGAGVLALPFAVFCVVAIAATGIQTRFAVSTSRLAPDFSHLSPLGGLKRLLSTTSLVEMTKGAVKISMVALIAWITVIRPELGRLQQLAGMQPPAMAAEMVELLRRIFRGALIGACALAAIDFIWQRMKFMKSMRMTKQEIKDEHKDQEGNPAIKGKLKQIRLSRARKRMLAAVPSATVIITNPTHFAVALKYDMDRMHAPFVVAKGADHIAAKIREVAKAHNVPIIEDPPLARALYATVEVDEPIPEAQFKAVATILGRIMGITRQRPASPVNTAAKRAS
ncbi:MAG TPA: flagellar biosynthesis protein FlhB [Stellaceae bacterium]|nr:flagellar biosynthesis protein FlhB [Stellaceae bacterium]